MRNSLLWVGVLLFMNGLATHARADEGMWVFNNLPTDILSQKYNFKPSPQWVDHVMKSSVRFNVGGSGSFVSHDGLVLTNHHVAGDTLHKISNAQHDYFLSGFYAKTLEEEIKAPDLELDQLISIEDVTVRVLAAVKPGMSPTDALAARREVIANIEKESFDKTGLRSNVITLYNGGQFNLYCYKRYTDVRLVFAPEFGIAFFGGDHDNFEYPRFDLDMALFRVYDETGKPLQPEHFFNWSANGVAENDLVFVSGNPGSTSRMFTTDHLKSLRDVRIPFSLDLLNRREIFTQQFALRGTEQARMSSEDLFGIQNSRKVYAGRTQGLEDPAIIAAKDAEEKQLKAAVATKPELTQYSGAWQQITTAEDTYHKILRPLSMLETGTGFNSVYFNMARTLVRMAEEDLKPNSARLDEYRDSSRQSLEQQLYSDAPIYDEYELAKLAFGFQLLTETYGEDNPLVQKVLAGKGPMARAEELILGTKLGNVAARQALAKQGMDGLVHTDDPMIQLALQVDQDARDVRQQFEQNVKEQESQGYAQIANILFTLKGTSTYPDATFTLRLAFGQVKGYDEGSTHIDPLTTIGGAFQHEIDHQSKDSFLLPDSWHKAKASLNLATPLNFISTADIIGGNSGSPVINSNAELVGLIFDGNIHSLVADYFYEDKLNRAVSVHSSGILEAMTKVYGAQRLVDELTNRQ